MKYSVDKQDSYSIFKVLDTKLNSIVAPELKTQLIILNNEGVRNVILDLGEVKFVDSSGLSAILVGNRLSQNAGGSLIISETSENVMRLVNISQLNKVLKIIPTIQEAKDYVMMQELEREIKGEESE